MESDNKQRVIAREEVHRFVDFGTWFVSRVDGDTKEAESIG